jgi:outer membrane protein assembly factor BamB
MIKVKGKYPKTPAIFYFEDGFGYFDRNDNYIFKSIFFEKSNKTTLKICFSTPYCFDGQYYYAYEVPKGEDSIMFGKPFEGENLQILGKNLSTSNQAFLKSRLFIVDYVGKKFILYDTKQKQLIWEIPDNAGRIFYDDDEIFIQDGRPNESLILCFSTQTGALLWEKDVSEIGKVFVRYEDKIGQIRKVYGKFEGNLIVCMTKYLLFGIEPHTGEVAWQLPQTHGLLPMDNNLTKTKTNSFI